MATATIDDFFPGIDEATFVERNTGVTVPLRFLWRVGADRRQLEIQGPSEHHFGAFFDRMTITGATLELERYRAGPLSLNIQPPLVITPGPEPNRAGNLFPSESPHLTLATWATQPYGAVASKELIDVHNHPLIWRVTIVVRGNGVVVSKTSYTFAREIGLIDCSGIAYGSFFDYLRLGTPEPPILVHAAPLLALDRAREARYRRRNSAEERTLAWGHRAGDVHVRWDSHVGPRDANQRQRGSPCRPCPNLEPSGESGPARAAG